MKTALVIGICLVLQTGCTAVSSRCLSLLHPCVSPDLCRSHQALLRNACVSEDSSCQSPAGCNQSVRAILAPSPECVCADENPCHVLRLLASFCLSHSDVEALPAPDDDARAATWQAGILLPPDPPPHLPPDPPPHPPPHLPPDPSPHLPPHPPPDPSPHLPPDPPPHLPPDPPPDPPPHTPPDPPPDHHRPSPGHVNNPRDQWAESRLSSSVATPEVSCVQAMTLCIQDEACNRQLVPFVQSCSSPQCEENLCRLAAGRLYSGLPESLTENLALCQCEPDDQDCHHFHTMLGSDPCQREPSVRPNCLEMLDNCGGEPVCRRTLEAFLSKCFGAQEVSLGGYSTADLLHVIDPDFFVGANKECRSAFVATMGTALQSACTCRGLDHHSLYRCNLLQQAIQNRSYFRAQEPNLNNIPPTKSREPEWQQERPWLSERWLYIVVSACVLVVILTLAIAVVVRKLRKRRDMSKNPELGYRPPDDSPKSLVL